ncbi:Redox-sensing transcriptional repressor Rex [subsurface metagenome]
MSLKKKNIPSVTINRLSIYHRCLEKILETQNGEDLKIISSFKIEEMTGINSAQIRKDLAYFGEFGKRGLGYPLIDLSRELKKILGLDKKWSVIIAGAGNLGKALVKYKGFQKRGFIIKGIFDNNPSKIGKKLGHIFIYDIKEIEKIIQAENINIGILVVPADSAQEVADKMVAGGIKAILNFAPVHIFLPPEIKIHNVDLSIEFEGLTYYLSW